MMLSLLLCAGLALAEPDPAILPPEPVTYPAEVTVADEAAPEPSPEPVPEALDPDDMSWGEWAYWGTGDLLLHLAGAIFAEAHRDHGAVLIADKIIEAIMVILTALGVVRYTRGSHPAPGQPASKRRPPASERLLAESEIRQISEKIRAEVEHQHQRQINRLDHRSAVLSAALIDFLGEQAAQELIALAGQTPGHDGAEP